MTLDRTLIPLTMLVALSLASPPAGADQRRGSGDRGRGQAVSRSAPRDSAPRAQGGSRSAPRQVAPRPQGVQQTPPRSVAPRPQTVQQSAPRGGAPQGVYGSTGGYDTRRYPGRSAYGPAQGVAVPRAAAPYRSYPGARSYGYARPYYPARPYSARPYYGHPYYGRPYYSRPYYSFRPRVSIGFGIWVGYPVAFPFYAGVGYSYGYPYAYSYPYAYPYPVPYPSPYPAYGGYPPAQPTSINVTPGTTAHGGVSFEITPADAQVFVDGTYVGVVGDFTPTNQPLTLTPGRHRIEVQAPGYEPIAFEVDVTPGQVIPYHGTMQPARPY